MIGRYVATAKIVLKEWGLYASDSGIMTEEKQEADFAEEEKRFHVDMFSLSFWTKDTEN